MALSLSAFRVNITLLTDGGQSVTNYTVSEYARVWMYIGLSVVNISHSIMYTDMLLECCIHKPSQVEIREVNYKGIVESSDQSWVSVLVNQLDQNFTKGETHTVRVFATNSVGTSNPLSDLLQVPCESSSQLLCTTVSC